MECIASGGPQERGSEWSAIHVIDSLCSEVSTFIQPLTVLDAQFRVTESTTERVLRSADLVALSPEPSSLRG